MSDQPVSPKLPIYEPPTGDEPLDAIELALVRALVAIIVRELREEAAAKANRAHDEDDL